MRNLSKSKNKHHPWLRKLFILLAGLFVFIAIIVVGLNINLKFNTFDFSKLKLPNNYTIKDQRGHPLINCLDVCVYDKADYIVANAVTKQQLVAILKTSLSTKGFSYEPRYPTYSCSGVPVIRTNQYSSCYDVYDIFFRKNKTCPLISVVINTSQQTADKISEFELRCNAEGLGYNAFGFPEGFVQLSTPFQKNTLQGGMLDSFYILPGVTNKEQVLVAIGIQMAQNNYKTLDAAAINGASSADFAHDAYYSTIINNNTNPPCMEVLVRERPELNLSTIVLSSSSYCPAP